MTTSLPPFSICIPVYNEEALLRSSLEDLQKELDAIADDYEIWICENGSRDKTPKIAQRLCEQRPQLNTFSVGTPGNGNYGKALKEGILRSTKPYVFCFEIDFWNTEFITESFRLFEMGEEMVIASKQLASSNDERGAFRKFASNFYNIMLSVVLGFEGTETHGVKSFQREAVLPIAQACVTERDVFASELVIRAERAGIRKVEVPVAIRELRPQRVNLWKRVPHVLRSLWTLWKSLD